jgi:hypothetical protein
MDVRFIIDARLPDGRQPSLERWVGKPVQLAGESLPGWLATLISGHEGPIDLTVEIGVKIQ